MRQRDGVWGIHHTTGSTAHTHHSLHHTQGWERQHTRRRPYSSIVPHPSSLLNQGLGTNPAHPPPSYLLTNLSTYWGTVHTWVLQGEEKVNRLKNSYCTCDGVGVIFPRVGRWVNLGSYTDMSSTFADQQLPRNTSPNAGGGGSFGVSANEYSCAHHVTWSPNKLWRSTSIFNLWVNRISLGQLFTVAIWHKVRLLRGPQ